MNMRPMLLALALVGRDLLALMEYQARLEWELVAMGYSLQQCIQERPR